MKRLLLLLALLGTVACGSTSSTTTPTPTPTPQPNRSPVIASVTATPTFGVQDFGIFTFNASATDADGDTLTFAWDIAGNARNGSTAQVGPFTNGGVGTRPSPLQMARAGV